MCSVPERALSQSLPCERRGRGAGAVVAVALLGEQMPDYFGTFDVAMFTLFSVTGGEPWPESLPRLNEDGTANGVVMLFCSAYFVITTWLILQVASEECPYPHL